MRFFSWLTGRFSQRSRAMLLYRRGMIKAKLRDHESAVADYTAVIDMKDAPADIRAMALYNRSVVYTASRHDSQAIRDLEKLLEMEGAEVNVRTEARRKLVRIQRSSDRLEDRQANGARPSRTTSPRAMLTIASRETPRYARHDDQHR